MDKIKNLVYAALAISLLAVGYQLYQWWASKSKFMNYKAQRSCLDHIQKVAKPQ